MRRLILAAMGLILAICILNAAPVATKAASGFDGAGDTSCDQRGASRESTNPPGNCLDFDGTDDYAEGAGVSTSLTQVTLEAWFYHRTLPCGIQRYVTLGDEVAVIRHDGNVQAEQLHFYIKTDGSFRQLRASTTSSTRGIGSTWPALGTGPT